MLTGLLSEFMHKNVTVIMAPMSSEGTKGINIVKGVLAQVDIESGALLIEGSNGVPTVVNWNHASQIERQ